jgi:diguanylate cyclase (GGDEF)-like protein/PAS domain S-box-containing protein
MVTKKNLGKAVQNTKMFAIMDGSPIPCALNDEHGNITFLNQAFIDTLGYSLNDIPTLDCWWEKAYPEESYRHSIIDAWNQALIQAKQSGSGFKAMEILIACKDRSVRTFIVGATQLEHNFKHEHLVTLYDVTDIKNLESLSSQKEHDFEELFENAEVSIWREDLSELYAELQNLSFDTVEQFKQHLQDNLEFTYELANKIKVINVNKATLKMFEAEDKTEFLSNIEKSFGENAISTFIDEACAIFNKDTVFRSEANFITSKGRSITAIISMPVPTNFENSRFVPISLLDITERIRAEKEFEFHSQILSNIDEGVYLVKASDGIIVFANPRFESMFGYEAGELIGKHVNIVNAPGEQTAKEKADGIISELNATGGWQGEVENIKKNGTVFSCKASVSKFDHPEFGVVWVSVHEDISEHKKAQEIIWHQANFDSVCNLPNRNLFVDRAYQEIKNSHRDALSFAILFIDLDHFKDVNDTLGHSIGDQLLIEVSQRILHCLRDKDTVSRFGGDEFTVLLTNVGCSSEIAPICEKILSTLSKAYYIGGERMFVSASIGVSIFPNDSESIETLLKYADQAMYLAKDSGRNCLRFFKRELQEAADTKRKLSNDLRQALKLNEFELYYQPVVEAKTKKIYKVEALIRWHHPQLGMVSPADFIPISEKNGLIVDIGNWVFEEAVQLVETIRESIPGFQINVNKSPVQFEEGEFQIDPWIAHLTHKGLPGDCICIELTEGVLLTKTKQVEDKLRKFSEAGLMLALDDFGTGYSSLAYIKKFKIDYIKIDISFVKNIDKNEDDYCLCKAIIAMAQSLGLKVVAEGVETTKQGELLLEAGCDYLQGYLFYRPMTKSKLLGVLKRQ